MKTRIITLLLGLMAAISLLTVTAWADDPTPPRPTNRDLQPLVGDLTMLCDASSEHATHKISFTAIGTYGGFSTECTKFDPNTNVYFYTLTVDAARFVEHWNQNNNDAHHRITDSITTVEFYLTYTVNDTTNPWALVDENGTPLTTTPNLTFHVTCQKPALPTAEELTALAPKVRVSLSGTSDEATYLLDETLYDLSAAANDNDAIYWGDNSWLCAIPTHAAQIVAMHNKATGGNYMLRSGSSLYLKYDMSAKKWVSYGYSFINVIPAPSMELLKELGVTSVNVSCQGGSHDSKTFALTSFDQLSGSWVYNETTHQDEYRLFLTSAAADSYVAQYSAAVDKTHTLDSSGYVALIWYQPGGTSHLSLDDGIAVYANTDPVEEDPYRERWLLVGNKAAFNITAVCVNETPRDTSHTRRYPAVTAPVQAAKPTVSSAKTFDGGVALYVGLSLLSVTGSAALLHKRKNV